MPHQCRFNDGNEPTRTPSSVLYSYDPEQLLAHNAKCAHPHCDPNSGYGTPAHPTAAAAVAGELRQAHLRQVVVEPEEGEPLQGLVVGLLLPAAPGVGRSRGRNVLGIWKLSIGWNEFRTETLG